MNRKKVKLFIACFGFMLFGLTVTAKQEPPVPGQKGMSTNAIPPPPVGLPIDGGLSFLLASGVVYGIYVLKRKK